MSDNQRDLSALYNKKIWGNFNSVIVISSSPVSILFSFIYSFFLTETGVFAGSSGMNDIKGNALCIGNSDILIGFGILCPLFGCFSLLWSVNGEERTSYVDYYAVFIISLKAFGSNLAN